MRKKIHLTSAEIKDQQLILYSKEEVDFNALKATEQVIVDSDQFSFVYLAEDNDDYVYIYVTKIVWEQLKNALDKNFKIVASSGETELILSNIEEELTYLVGNIEGNSNYGDEFVLAVEENFIR
ncbi:hypothetical protein [Bacillus sp. 2205SS5-2]|uniref:UPF0738 family protein n=1 Tax=Bacillus sp. 2205SS5-2 TaxID=3109031 RepID=UPI0030077A0D